MAFFFFFFLIQFAFLGIILIAPQSLRFSGSVCRFLIDIFNELYLSETDEYLLKVGDFAEQGREYDGIHRTTFVIDENGIIDEVIENVKTKEHAAPVLN